MTVATPSSSATNAAVKCTFCNGTGRWAKDVLTGKPQESVYCPHCHGSGAGGDLVVSKSSEE
jgi:DnaJ-class molecular chaperone